MDPTGGPAEVEVRLDRWLWAVRVFKTRSLAIAACDAGHVKIGGNRAKPARSVHVGEVVTVQLGPLTRTLKVVGLLGARVGAKVVPQFMEDLTPPEELAKPREPRVEPLFHRPRGSGRPTKRDRRLLDRLGL
ncbi:MAG: RNA-binding S4 domain-containing protein [Verrucomicrobia bacterium]|nr:RNA-binding S4 domain-containing protein [Verrucomicrobiota bacterium]